VTDSNPTNHELALRLDQSITDFKVSFEQRFLDHEHHEDLVALGASALVAQRFTDQDRLLDERDRRQTTLLNERFTTQTTTLNAAFAAAEKARQEALATTQEATSRTDNRIKDIEDRLNQSTGRGIGRSEILGWLVGAATVISAIAYLVTHH
jgi:hypothetical protein